jgi:hypothetical protein
MSRLRRMRAGQGFWAFASAGLLAVLLAPFAFAVGEGQPLDGGARNPSNNQSQSYERETEFIANNATYGTRQSNKSSNGGGAIYGCRSGEGGTPRAMRPCIRANNLAKGYAFEFDTDGVVGGTFTVGNGGDGTKPFTTNATGVADGLNADEVDGKSADDVVNDARAFNRFARVNSAGALVGNRGATSSTRDSDGNYTVVFDADVSSCALSATQIDVTNPGATGAVVQSDNRSVKVQTRGGGGADGTEPTAPADQAFHLTATC